MKKPIESANYFFVDESGDPTFFDRYGNLIVGQEGCSPVLILGFIETTSPGAVRHALAELHRVILPPMNISKRRHPSANRMWRFTPKTTYRKCVRLCSSASRRWSSKPNSSSPWIRVLFQKHISRQRAQILRPSGDTTLRKCLAPLHNQLDIHFPTRLTESPGAPQCSRRKSGDRQFRTKMADNCPDEFQN